MKKSVLVKKKGQTGVKILLKGTIVGWSEKHLNVRLGFPPTDFDEGLYISIPFRLLKGNQTIESK
jgi:hypothetical protein